MNYDVSFETEIKQLGNRTLISDMLWGQGECEIMSSAEFGGSFCASVDSQISVSLLAAGDR